MAKQPIEHRKARSIPSTRFSVFNWRSRSVTKLAYCFGERIHWFCVWTEYQTEGRYKWKIYIDQYAFKNIRICADGAFHDSVNLQI